MAQTSGSSILSLYFPALPDCCAGPAFLIGGEAAFDKLAESPSRFARRLWCRPARETKGGSAVKDAPKLPIPLPTASAYSFRRVIRASAQCGGFAPATPGYRAARTSAQ